MHNAPEGLDEMKDDVTHSYKDVVYAILDNDRFCLGYITRRHHIYGLHQTVPNGWMATKSLLEPKWFGNFDTRREARKYLSDIVDFKEF